MLEGDPADDQRLSRVRDILSIELTLACSGVGANPNRR